MGTRSETDGSMENTGALFPEDQDPSLSLLLEDFLTPQIELAPDPLAQDQLLGLYVSELSLDLPIEIQTLRDDQQQLALGTTPPTQWIETSVEPVLHRVRVTLALDESDEGAPVPEIKPGADLVPDPFTQ
jgi:hypothetical protein